MMTAAFHPMGLWSTRGDPTLRAAVDVLLESVEQFNLSRSSVWMALELAQLDPKLDVAEQVMRLYLYTAVLAGMAGGSTLVETTPQGAFWTIVQRLGADAALTEKLRNHVKTVPDHGAARAPLVMAQGWIQTQRVHAMEERTRAALAVLHKRKDIAGPAAQARLAEVMANPHQGPKGPVQLNAQQQEAVLAAVTSSLSVITGGPGTGKTSVLVSILRVLARDPHWSVDQVALAAPTGKAADRMKQSVLEALGSIAGANAVDRALKEHPVEAVTLHRLLQWSPGMARFRVNRANRLTHKMVLVDEASMLDLGLAEALLSSLGDDTQLVLLGDADQLPAVETGAVFRDLCQGAVKKVTRLLESHRMDPRDPHGAAILSAATSINAGQGDAARWLKRAGDVGNAEFNGITWVDAETGIHAAAEAWFAHAWLKKTVSPLVLDHTLPLDVDTWSAVQREAVNQLLQQHAGARVLCALRQGPGVTGAALWNQRLHDRLARWRVAQGFPALVEPLGAGDPITVLRNDYQRGLFNGDSGVVVAVRGRRGGKQLLAVFRRGDVLSTFPVEAMGDVAELGWATTVHKAQGSEMDTVLVALPREVLPLVTRELLYTAVTRARRGVVLLGSAEVLQAAIATPSLRMTGLLREAA